MNKYLQAGAFLLVAAVATYAGYYFSRPDPGAAAAELAVGRLLQTSFLDLDGKRQTLSQKSGKIIIVNFWATWCGPCREEIPELLKIQRKHAKNGVEVVGIALDNVAKVAEYVKEMQIDYSLLIGAADILALNKDLGNTAGVLPFTVVLDRNGKLAYRHAGALTEPLLDGVLRPLL